MWNLMYLDWFYFIVGYWWWLIAEVSSAPADTISDIGRVEYWANQVQSVWFGWPSDCSQSLERLLCEGKSLSRTYLVTTFSRFHVLSRLFVELVCIKSGNSWALLWVCYISIIACATLNWKILFCAFIIPNKLYFCVYLIHGRQKIILGVRW